jgi:pilus assembly protein CpaE
MAQISSVITTTDPDFRARITKLLRTSGFPVSIIDEKHQGSGTSVSPDLAVVDIRSGSTTAFQTVEQTRGMWPATAVFAVAGSAGPDQILEAMRAGANEFLAWGSGDHALDEAFRAALKRTAEKKQSARDGARSGVTFSFFGAKGGAGTTTLAVNSAIEIARVTKRPTLIIDLHEFLGEVALFLGVRPRFTLIDAIDNLHRLDQEFLKELVVRHKSGLDILAGGDQVDRPGKQDVGGIEHLLQLLSRTYDFIVIDAGSVTSPVAEVAVCIADTIYLVANPDVASIRNTHRVADRIAQLGADKERVRILLNRMSEHHQIAPKQIETALGHQIYMAFPSDYGAVSTALNSGVPLTLSNHSEMAAQLTRLTKEILHMPADAEPAPVRAKGHFLGLF